MTEEEGRAAREAMLGERYINLKLYNTATPGTAGKKYYPCLAAVSHTSHMMSA